ncbi:MAG: DUF3800 domain-containing protein [Gammaproteobacteria bacterium]|nr:DUF3800 domain-containing protein [Gammaproteobacteria bacterium]
MKIYIDESGVFKPEESKNNSISCITALIIPDAIETDLLKNFEQWKLQPSLKDKKDKNGEVKGSKLDEQEISSFLLLLARFDVIAEAVCIDLGGVSECQVLSYQSDLANSFGQSQTGKKINANFRKEVILSLKPPLFIQSFLFCNLLSNVMDISIPYYAQRFPSELGNFKWVVDAKNIKISEYEQILEHLVKPFLQWINYNGEDSGYVAGEDYTALDKYLIPHDYLLEPWNKEVRTDSKILDIGLFMKDITFMQSHCILGLQMADLIANCVRRSMMNNLQFEGWKYLANLFVHRKNMSLKFVAFSEVVKENPPYTYFVNYIHECGKRMIVPADMKDKIADTKKGYSEWSYEEGVYNGYHKRVHVRCY